MARDFKALIERADAHLRRSAPAAELVLELRDALAQVLTSQHLLDAADIGPAPQPTRRPLAVAPGQAHRSGGVL